MWNRRGATVKSVILLTSSCMASIAWADEHAALLASADEVVVIGHDAEGDAKLIRATWRTVPSTDAVGSFRFAHAGTGGCDLLEAAMYEVGEAPEGDMPTDAAYTPDGSILVLAHRNSSNLVLYDAHSRAYLRSIAISGAPQALAMLPDGEHVVTANLDTDTMSLVDLVSGVEELVVDVGVMPGAIGVTADGTRAIVGNTGEATLSIIDLKSGTELHRIDEAGFTMTLTVAPESGAVALDFSGFLVIGDEMIVHPSTWDDSILFIEVDSGAKTVLSSLDWPRGIAASADDSIAVVSHYNQPFISVVDIASASISRSISLGTTAWGPIAVSGDGSRAAVAVLNAVRVVDLDTETVSAPLSTASVYDLLTTADGEHALGIGFYGSLIDLEGETIVANLNNSISTPVGAVSPVDPLAAMAANVFGEDLVFVSTDGASGSFLEQRSSGPDPEGDKCRSVAVHGATDRVVAVNLFSRTAEVFDGSSGELLGRFATGSRPSEVAISPDGTIAVVANLDSYHATIIDLEDLTTTDATVSYRGSRVVISPDSRYAYVAVVSSGDGVWRIDLETGSVAGPKLSTGDMGSVGYAYSRTSGITLSHDGATLVTCGSFSDTVTVIDTASWAVQANIDVGDFPTLASFSEDDETLYVSLSTDQAIAVVDVDGASSALVDTIPIGAQPKHLVPSPDGMELLVLLESQASLVAVDLESGVVDREVTLPIAARGFALSESGECVILGAGVATVQAGGSGGYASTQDGAVYVLDHESFDLLESIPTGVSAAQFAFDASSKLGAIASPRGDGVVIVRTQSICTGDLDENGGVDGGDLTVLLGSWGTCAGCPADLTEDGIVDGADLTVLLGNWGACP